MASRSLEGPLSGSAGDSLESRVGRYEVEGAVLDLRARLLKKNDTRPKSALPL
jgi:hypothetical protein